MFALLITNTNFNVASFMGLIMVIGIVAKNGILLLDADERARDEGGSAKDAMLLMTLPAGGYTAQASGVGGTGGLIIVEAYEVP